MTRRHRPARAALTAGFATALLASAALPGTAVANGRASHHCRGPVACIQAPGAQLLINRVQYWGPMGTAPNGDALIVVWVGVYDTTGPKNYPQNPHHGILDPNPDADAYNGSYYVVDSTHQVDAEYSNGCRYNSGDPSNPFLVYNKFPKNRLLYPHQHLANVPLCFAVANPTKAMTFQWHPNHDHAHAYSVRIPGARTYRGNPTPTN